MEAKTIREEIEEQEDSSYAKADAQTRNAWARSIDIVNSIHEAGFRDFSVSIITRATGYSGDAAFVVMQLWNNGHPIFDGKKQEELTKAMSAYFFPKSGVWNDKDAQGAPVAVVLKDGDINKKIIGLEGDRIVIYRPAPEVLNAIDYLADRVRESKSLPPRRKN